MTSISIAQAAKKTGITSRTLRHYDAIGLLTPSETAHDGRRFYGEEELLRLQHILVLKELGVDLTTTKRVLDAEPGHAVGLLKDHLAALTKERDRYARLATTVSRTIDHLERGTAMTTDEMFEGFQHARYEPEARERWGDAAIDSGNANWEKLGDDGKKRHMQIDREIVEALGAAARIHLAPTSAEVQQTVARHYEWLTQIWTPNAEAYVSLTQMYVDDERFRQHYDEVTPGAAALLRDAAVVYALENLT
ncbi:MerR family transcriptional regulator [Demequina sp.]|uniref:MerR family transcriptional regulator n=1 Tax=Demequina sp. TaxID=2050685 RepID=UPI003D097886